MSLVLTYLTELFHFYFCELIDVVTPYCSLASVACT